MLAGSGQGEGSWASPPGDQGQSGSHLTGGSSERQRPVRVIVAKLGLDGHDRGIKVVARALRDAGMEVVYLGMRLTNEQIVRAALQEDVDAIGLSILSGAHTRLMPRFMEAVKAAGLQGRVLVVVGGTIPDQDVEPLKRIGVRGVFPVGSSTRDIIRFIRENVPALPKE